MKKPRYQESQVFQILKEVEAGIPVPCCKRYKSNATFHQWRSKYGGTEVSNMRCMKELQQENARLMKMYAEDKLKAEIISEALEKSGEPISVPRDGTLRSFRRRRIDPLNMPLFWNIRDPLSLSDEAQR